MESVVTGLDGVASAEASFRKNTAVVVYDPSKVTPEQIAQQINSQTFYRARVLSVPPEFIETARFNVPGLNPRQEAIEWDRALSGVKGIVGSSLIIESFSLDYDVREISPEQLLDIINSRTSYTASIDTTVWEEPAPFPVVESTATAVIRVQGMRDQQTVSQVTGALLLDGIVDGSVNTEDATLTIVYDTAKLTAQMIMEALGQAVPNNISLVSVTEPGPGGSVLTSAWFVLTLVGLAIVAVFAWPVLRRRLQPTTGGGKGAPGSGRSRGQRRRRK